MKLAVVTVLAAMFSIAAHADPIATYGQNFQSYIPSISLDQSAEYIPIVYLPAFNQSLGTLNAVQLGLTLLNQAEFYDQPPELPDPPPKMVDFTFGLTLAYGGEYSSAPIVESVTPSYVPGFRLSAAATAYFNQLFFVSSLSPFESNCTGSFYCESSFFVDPYVISSIDNAETQDLESISFDLSETFYYTPATAISEPGSTGLLLFGGITAIALAEVGRGRHWMTRKTAA